MARRLTEARFQIDTGQLQFAHGTLHFSQRRIFSLQHWIHRADAEQLRMTVDDAVNRIVRQMLAGCVTAHNDCVGETGVAQD